MNKRKTPYVTKTVNEFTAPDLEEGALEIVTALSLPEEMKRPIRFANQYSCDRTAVVIPWQELKVNWNAPTAASQLPASDLLFFVFRNPLCRLIYYLATAVAYVYQWAFLDLSTGVPISGIKLYCPGGLTTAASPLFATPVGANKPHGNILYPRYTSEGVAGDYTFLWGDNPAAVAGTYGNILISCTADPGGGNIYCYELRFGQRVLQATIPFVGLTLAYTFKVPHNGYYSFGFAPNNSTFIQVQTTNASGASMWCHLADKDINLNMSNIEAIRSLGAAFRFSNEASDLNRQGNIVQVQIPGGEDWLTFSNSGYNGVAAFSSEVQSRLARNGTDGFLKPTQDEDFAFQYPFVFGDNGVLTESYVDMQVTNYSFIACAISCTTPAGCDFILRVSPLNEYKTKNSWIDIQKSSHTTAQWIQALEVFKSMEQFYDNPVHVKQILSTIGKYARIAAIWGTKIAKVMAYLGKST